MENNGTILTISKEGKINPNDFSSKRTITYTCTISTEVIQDTLAANMDPYKFIADDFEENLKMAVEEIMGNPEDSITIKKSGKLVQKITPDGIVTDIQTQREVKILHSDIT